jgi:Domain of unknown function (DUF4262)
VGRAVGDHCGVGRPEITTALDAPRSMLDDHERAVVQNVERHGFHIVVVQQSDEDAASQPEWREVPDWTYSVGLYLTFGVPEVVVFSLPSETATTVLWDIARAARDGRTFASRQVHVDGLPSFLGQRFSFEEVDDAWSESLFGWARWFYGAAFTIPIRQYLWPDARGRFAWDDGVSDHICQAQRRLLYPPTATGDPPGPRC